MVKSKEFSKKACQRKLLSLVFYQQKSNSRDKMPQGEVFIKFLERGNGYFRFVVMIDTLKKYADVNIKTGGIEWL